MELATFSTKEEENDFFSMLTNGNTEVDKVFVGAADEGSESQWYNLPSNTKIEYPIRFLDKASGYEDTFKNLYGNAKDWNNIST
ncbi:unnamed protein product [Diamesa serratosioi]